MKVTPLERPTFWYPHCPAMICQAIGRASGRDYWPGLVGCAPKSNKLLVWSGYSRLMGVRFGRVPWLDRGRGNGRYRREGARRSLGRRRSAHHPFDPFLLRRSNRRLTEPELSFESDGPLAHRDPQATFMTVQTDRRVSEKAAIRDMPTTGCRQFGEQRLFLFQIGGIFQSCIESALTNSCARNANTIAQNIMSPMRRRNREKHQCWEESLE